MSNLSPQDVWPHQVWADPDGNHWKVGAIRSDCHGRQVFLQRGITTFLIDADLLIEQFSLVEKKRKV